MDITGIKAITDSSNNMISWGLAMLGGSLLALLSTSYLQPKIRRHKWFYLFLVPGWVLVLASVYYGNQTTQHTIMVNLNPDLLSAQIGSIQQAYIYQRNILFGALAAFSIWVLFYLFWWMGNSSDTNTK